MFAQLGDIQFELITYFNGIRENSSYNYAQHERINKKPLLQFLGENLKTIELKLNFHASFCTPSKEVEKLKTVAELGTPMQFIKGNGEYLGVFVIDNIESETEQTTNEGDILSIQLELRLLEYDGEIPEEQTTEGGLKTK
jgi:phage protein U